MVTLDEYLHKMQVAEQLCNSLTTNRFSRDIPTDIAGIESRVRESLFYDDELRFMVLWGGSKESRGRDSADAADIRSLDFLEKIQTYLSEMYKSQLGSSAPSLRFDLLFCDMHHILVNGRRFEETENYHKSLFQMASKRELVILRLSDLLGTGCIKTYTDSFSRRTAHKILQDTTVSKKLTAAAEKHSRLAAKYGAKAIARMYVEVEIYFLKKVSERYPQAVFVSFSDPDKQRPIAEAAQVPMLYFHSAGKGHHECPWYNNIQDGHI